MKHIRMLFVSGLFLLMSVPPALPVDVVTVEGRNIRGKQLNIADGILSVDKEKIPLQEVVSCRWYGKRKSGPNRDEYTFLFINGDRIKGSIRKTSGRHLVLSSPSFGTVEVARDTISRIRFSPETGRSIPDAAYASEAEKDTVLFANGDSLQGRVTGISATGIVLESVLGKMNYSFSDLYAVAFMRTSSGIEKVKDAYFRITTVNGESVSGKGIAHSGTAVTVSSFLAGSIRVPESGLSLLKVANGRFIYLSDIKPSNVEERPFWEGGYVWHYRKDKSIDGNTLCIKGREHTKGLGVHSFCRLGFDLDGSFSSFVATVGIDDEVEKYGNVDIAVLGDGAVLYEKKGLDRDSGPVSITVDISSVDKLEIITGFGQLFDIGDHADWADAYLIRKKE